MFPVPPVAATPKLAWHITVDNHLTNCYSSAEQAVVLSKSDTNVVVRMLFSGAASKASLDIEESTRERVEMGYLNTQFAQPGILPFL